MARTRISSLKQLHTALRSLSIAEFMDLSTHGRAAYGALYDELRDEFDDTRALPAPPPEPRALLPRSRPPSNPPPPQAPAVSVFPPGEGFKQVQPVARQEDLQGWVRALTALGFEHSLAEDALAGRRSVWVRGQILERMEEVGFTFEPGEAVKVANVGTDVYAA